LPFHGFEYDNNIKELAPQTAAAGTSQADKDSTNLLKDRARAADVTDKNDKDTVDTALIKIPLSSVIIVYKLFHLLQV
jgi:hypothetical protein